MPSSGGQGLRALPRRAHPYALLIKFLQVGRTMLLPAVVVGASMGGMRMGRMILWGLIFLAVPTLLFAIAEYLALRYRLEGDELILDSGVFSRRHRIVPLARVQNLDVRQNLLQRLFDVAELRVETAGGDADEPVLLVLGRQQAESLRSKLLAGRDRAAPAADATPASAADVLAHLSPRELALAGATANEAGVIFALLIAALEVAYQLPLGIPRVRLEPRVLLPDLPLSSAVLLVFAVLLAVGVFAWLLSIAGALAAYWDFVLERTGGKLRKRYGWLDRREVTIPLTRVQALRIEESWMRRPLGYASLKIETAGGGPGEARRRGAEAFLPLSPVREVPRLTSAVFSDLESYNGIVFRRVHPFAIRRAFVRYSLPVLVLAGLALWLGPIMLSSLALLPFSAFAARIHYRHLGYFLAPGYLVARSGFFNRVTWIVPEHRIQTLHLIQTPFQRRWHVASLVVDTAAGQVGIPDLPWEEARTLLESLAQRVEDRSAAAEAAAPGAGRRRMENGDGVAAPNRTSALEVNQNPG